MGAAVLGAPCSTAKAVPAATAAITIAAGAQGTRMAQENRPQVCKSHRAPELKPVW